MLARIVIACIGLSPLVQAQLVERLNGPIVGNVSRFAWTPDGRYVVYGARRDSVDLDVVINLSVADRSEAVYEPYPYLSTGSCFVEDFVFLPDRTLVAPRISFIDWFTFPPHDGDPLHVIARSTALPITVRGAQSPIFLEDGRMLSRTVTHVYRGDDIYRGWIGRWDDDSAALEISPPAQQGNYVSPILPALRAGVAVFGWRDDYASANDAELLSVPLGGGAPVPLTPPPASGQREWVDAIHVRSSDELVIYSADEVPSVAELWAVPVDGSLLPRRLNPPLVPGRVIHAPTVSPDGARIVYVSDVDTHEVHELWSTDIDGGSSMRLSGPQTTGGDVGDAYHDDFWVAPDSARVVYLADERVDEVFELFSAPLDGHAPAVRLHAALPASYDALSKVHFTPGGCYVVFAVGMPRGVVLLSAPADGSAPPRPLNWPFPQGGGVLQDASGILSTVAIAPGGRHVFFLGEQDTDGVVELFSVPIDGSAAPIKWNAPLAAGGDVTGFELRPSPGGVLYRADQEQDEHFELYLSQRPDAPPPQTPTGPPGGAASATVPE
jgi:hypothetical protein